MSNEMNYTQAYNRLLEISNEIKTADIDSLYDLAVEAGKLNRICAEKIIDSKMAIQRLREDLEVENDQTNEA